MGPAESARIPRYATLLDENKLNMYILELMTHHLCLGHQIIYSPTSLPSPLYIALEDAKRGRNQYNAWAQANLNQPPTIRTHEELTVTAFVLPGDPVLEESPRQRLIELMMMDKAIKKGKTNERDSDCHSFIVYFKSILKQSPPSRIPSNQPEIGRAHF